MKMTLKALVKRLKVGTRIEVNRKCKSNVWGFEQLFIGEPLFLLADEYKALLKMEVKEIEPAMDALLIWLKNEEEEGK